MVQMSSHTAAVHTSHWTTTQKSRQQAAYEKDIYTLNPPSWRPALAVNYSCLRRHGCVSPVPVRKEERYEIVFTARVSVSYYHQMMMNTADSQMYRSEAEPEDICHFHTLS